MRDLTESFSCFLGHGTLASQSSHSNQDSKWVRANSQAEVVRDGLASHPSLHATETGISSGWMVGTLGSIAPFTFVYDSFFLSLNSTLDRMLDHLLLEEEKAIPLRMPSPEEYW